jgi:hypothetical protein
MPLMIQLYTSFTQTCREQYVAEQRCRLLWIPWRQRQNVLPKHRYPTTRLHGSESRSICNTWLVGCKYKVELKSQKNRQNALKFQIQEVITMITAFCDVTPYDLVVISEGCILASITIISGSAVNRNSIFSMFLLLLVFHNHYMFRPLRAIYMWNIYLSISRSYFPWRWPVGAETCSVYETVIKTFRKTTVGIDSTSKDSSIKLSMLEKCLAPCTRPHGTTFW